MEKIKRFFFKNNNIKQTLIKNTVWIGVSSVFSKIVRALVIIYAARVLGVDSYGIYTYAAGIIAVFAVLSDMGISSIAVREISKNKDTEKNVYATSFIIKLLFLSLMVILCILIGPYLLKYPESRSLIPLFVSTIAIESLRSFLYVFARAKNNIQHESINSMINEIFCTLLILLIFVSNPTPKTLILSLFLGNTAGLLVAFIHTRKSIFYVFRHIKKDLIKPLVRLTAPFAILSILGIFMTNIDAVIIGILGDRTMLGLFGSAQKLISVMYILPGFMSTSLLPVLSGLISKKDTDTIKRILQVSSQTLFMVAIPIICGGILLSKDILVFLYGAQYVEATTVFQLLLVTLLWVFPGTLFAEIIIAENKQSVFLKTGIIGALINIVLDVILIPKYGINGSAVATIIAQAVVNTLFYLEVKKIYKDMTIPRITNLLIPSILMMLAIFVLRIFKIHVIITIIVSGLIYVSYLYFTKNKTLNYYIGIFRKKNTLNQ